MSQLRVALAQIDLTVGDIAGNCDKVVEYTRAAALAEAHLAVFPEMAVTGYMPEDLVFRRSFGDASAAAVATLAQRLADEGLGGLTVVVGYLDHADGPRNACAVLRDGRQVARYFKHHLPNYGVFDEFRYFVPGRNFVVVRVHDVDVALTICEDMWADGGPFAVAGEVGVGLVLSINGSPYEREKEDARLTLAADRAREAGAPVAYVNSVGAQDEIVYDGDSLVVGADGTLIARSPHYVEDLLVVDLDLAETQAAGSVEEVLGMTVEVVDLHDEPVAPYSPQPAQIAEPLTGEAEIWGALVTGTRDYVQKNGFSSVLLGLSGGIDSAVVATVAADALGADRVHVVGMPSKWSSDHSLSDAEGLATRQGLHWRVVPIAPMVEAYEKAVSLSGLAAENLQARVRGTLLMALSNAEGHLVLAPGNKSELATGYSTLYGDSVGGFGPIKDVLKTSIWAIARWRNADAEARGQTPPIPEACITKPPSAELAPGQLDSDRLPDYEQLDAVLADYVDRDMGRDELVEAGHDAELVERVIRLVDIAEYKRRQYPPGPKISPKAFGRDRRLPITNAWREPSA